MAAAKFLAIDIGASSGRAIAATLENGKLRLEEIHRFPNGAMQVLGHLHWNIFSLYNEIKTGLTKYARDVTTQLTGFGIDTWGVDYGLVGANNEILGNPFAYRDSRTNDIMEKAFQLMPKADIYNHTGIQFMQFNTIFQLLAATQANSPSLAVADKLLFIPDLLNFMFSGVKATERTIASTSQLYDPAQKIWISEIFDELNLPINIMPDIVSPGTRLGSMLPDILKETGLQPVDVIASAGHDTGAAIAAVPAEGEDWAYLSSGTWSLMGIESPTPIINDLTFKYNFTNETGVNDTIRFLKNIGGLWLVQECRRIWANEGEDVDFGTLVKMAYAARPFVGMVDPEDSSFMLPEHMPHAIQDYCRKTGQDIPETKGEIIRVALEGLALCYRNTMEQMNEIRQKPIRKLNIVGGGTQNGLLNQFAANACGIQVVAGPVEATALGNVLVQAMATGVIGSLNEAREVIRQSFELKYYEPQDVGRWDKQFATFKKIINQ